MRRVILAVVGTAAVLVLLLTFKTRGTPATASAPPPIISRSSASASSPVPGGSSSAAGGGSAGATTTVTGSAAPTIYGPVQVRITVTKGKLTAVGAIEYPERQLMDQQINAEAIPELNQEALAAGSAHIDAVSGATYTSNGYISSLQSALDKAGL